MNIATTKIDLDKAAEYYPRVRLKAINILPTRGVIYVDNPIAASTSIKLLLDRIYSGADWYNPENVHKDRLLPEFRKPLLKTLADKPEPWVFSCVSLPENRIISVYEEKMRILKFRGPVNEILGRKDPKADVSIDDFVTAISRTAPEDMDPHWRPQTYNLMLDAVQYDYIAKLDGAADPLLPVVERLGVSLEDIPVRTSTSSGADQDVKLSAQSIEKIREIYAQDYEQFGYS